MEFLSIAEWEEVLESRGTWEFAASLFVILGLVFDFFL